MADNTAAIAALTKILDSGASAVSVDGQSVSYDVTSLRKRLQYLIDTDDTLNPTGVAKRPLIQHINLGGLA